MSRLSTIEVRECLRLSSGLPITSVPQQHYSPVQAVARFLFRKHGSRATKSNVKVIYGPNDEKLAEVAITEDEE